MRRAFASLVFLCTLQCGIPEEESYRVRGTVEAVDVDARTVKIAHDAIPGFMPAMTMSFDVAAAELLEGLRPGASVLFTVRRSATVLTITTLRITVPPPAGSGPGVGMGGDIDRAPPFALVNQDGAQVALADFKGRAVLLDFIFTRCPGPCPILTSAHARLQRELPDELRSRTVLLSISLDPAHDTPERLREYASRRGADLSNWSFLTGDPTVVAEVVASYYVGSIRRPDGQIDHTIATFLIDSNGRIVEHYLGLQHTPEEIIADLQRALSSADRSVVDHAADGLAAVHQLEGVVDLL